MRDKGGRFAIGSKHHVKHGMSKTKIYGIWRSMHDRCGNPNVHAYKDYGARGIAVCDRWQSFEYFLHDMGERPAGLSLERVDNDKGYSPDNCIWASKKTQSRNRRNLRMLTVNGRERSMGEWSEISGISVATIWYRIKLGWTGEQAVLTPKITQRRGIPRGTKLVDAYGAEHGVRWTEPEDKAA